MGTGGWSTVWVKVDVSAQEAALLGRHALLHAPVVDVGFNIFSPTQREQ